MKRYFCFILIFGLIFLFSSCSKINPADEKLDNNLEKPVNTSLSGICTPMVVDQLNIHIKKLKGEIDIKDDSLVNELIKILDSGKIIKTGTGCPFGNKITISRNNDVLKEFFIAEDGCYTVKRSDGSIVEIERDIYEKIENTLQKSNNSLDRTKQ